MRTSLRRGQAAFTVVEIIVTLVVLGILGAVIVGRFTAPNTFNEAAAQDALISTIRAAQQAALGRDDVSFEINSSGDNWQFLAKTPTDDILSVEVSADDVKLETGTADELGGGSESCSSGTRFDTPVDNFELTFDTQGNLTSFTNTTVGLEPMSATFNGVRICVNDTVASSVCVSRAGYASAGDCDA